MTDLDPAAPTSPDERSRLGRAIAARHLGGVAGRGGLGRVAASSVRFARGWGRPAVVRRHLAHPLRAATGPTTTVRTAPIPDETQPPRWWVPPTREAEPLPGRGLRRVVRRVPTESGGPGSVSARITPQTVPMRLPAEVDAIGRMTTPADSRSRRSNGPLARPPAGGPPGNAGGAGAHSSRSGAGRPASTDSAKPPTSPDAPRPAGTATTSPPTTVPVVSRLLRRQAAARLAREERSRPATLMLDPRAGAAARDTGGVPLPGRSVHSLAGPVRRSMASLSAGASLTGDSGAGGRSPGMSRDGRFALEVVGAPASARVPAPPTGAAAAGAARTIDHGGGLGAAGTASAAGRTSATAGPRHAAESQASTHRTALTSNPPSVRRSVTASAPAPTTSQGNEVPDGTTVGSSAGAHGSVSSSSSSSHPADSGSVSGSSARHSSASPGTGDDAPSGDSAHANADGLARRSFEASGSDEVVRANASGAEELGAPAAARRAGRLPGAGHRRPGAVRRRLRPLGTDTPGLRRLAAPVPHAMSDGRSISTAGAPLGAGTGMNAHAVAAAALRSTNQSAVHASAGTREGSTASPAVRRNVSNAPATAPAAGSTTGSTTAGAGAAGAARSAGATATGAGSAAHAGSGAGTVAGGAVASGSTPTTPASARTASLSGALAHSDSSGHSSAGHSPAGTSAAGIGTAGIGSSGFATAGLGAPLRPVRRSSTARRRTMTEEGRHDGALTESAQPNAVGAAVRGSAPVPVHAASPTVRGGIATLPTGPLRRSPSIGTGHTHAALLASSSAASATPGSQAPQVPGVARLGTAAAGRPVRRSTAPPARSAAPDQSPLSGAPAAARSTGDGSTPSSAPPTASSTSPVRRSTSTHGPAPVQTGLPHLRAWSVAPPLATVSPRADGQSAARPATATGGPVRRRTALSAGAPMTFAPPPTAAHPTPMHPTAAPARPQGADVRPHLWTERTDQAANPDVIATEVEHRVVARLEEWITSDLDDRVLELVERRMAEETERRAWRLGTEVF